MVGRQFSQSVAYMYNMYNMYNRNRKKGGGEWVRVVMVEYSGASPEECIFFVSRVLKLVNRRERNYTRTLLALGPRTYNPRVLELFSKYLQSFSAIDWIIAPVSLQLVVGKQHRARTAALRQRSIRSVGSMNDSCRRTVGSFLERLLVEIRKYISVNILSQLSP